MDKLITIGNEDVYLIHRNSLLGGTASFRFTVAAHDSQDVFAIFLFLVPTVRRRPCIRYRCRCSSRRRTIVANFTTAQQQQPRA